LLTVVIALAAIASTGQAQTKLRWKFTPGEKVNYEMTMDMNMEMKIGDKPLSSKMSQRIYTTWQVKEIADDGTAELIQTVDRIVMESTSPGGDSKLIKYDSRNKEQEPGAAAFTQLFDAMLNQSFVMKVTPQGEIKDMQVPPSLIEAMKKSGGPAAAMFSEDSLKQMMGRSMFSFPAELTKGQTWDMRLTMPNPLLGKQIVSTKYTYAGPTQLEGRDVEKIDLSMEMKFDVPPEAKVKIDITEQTGDGAIYFDNELGLPLETDLVNNVTMQIGVNDQKLDQKLTTRVSTKKVAPEEAAAAGSKEKDAPPKTGADKK
jgi:hypothetical protein